MSWDSAMTPVQGLIALYVFGGIVLVLSLGGLLSRSRKPHDSPSHSD
jgi:hypothetical protein